MESLDEERQVFFLLCVKSAQECKDALALLNDTLPIPVKLVVIKHAIISYARPFSSNKASYKEQPWRLPDEYIPSGLSEAHNKAIEFRNRFVAHFDIPAFEPELLTVDSNIAFGHNSPTDSEYLDFADTLSALSSELLERLWPQARKLGASSD